MCLCWAVARTRTLAHGSFFNAKITGAIFMASGLVPRTTNTRTTKYLKIFSKIPEIASTALQTI